MVRSIMNYGRLTPEQIQKYKALAVKIDREEGEEIKARGREFFRRHKLAREMVARLKARRLAEDISLTELSTRTGIAKSNLSRLENSETVAPTLDTLERYADALGMKLQVELV
jgi:DNA-binding Xre family transcriptional regulator